jgi:hypothetical protein
MQFLIQHIEKDAQGLSIPFQEPSHSSALFLITTPILFLYSGFSFQLHITLITDHAFFIRTATIVAFGLAGIIVFIAANSSDSYH